MTKRVEVYRVNDALEAEMVTAFLKAHGIEAWAYQESAGATLGLTGGFLGRVKVYVLEEQEENAVAMLEAMERGEFELPADTPVFDEEAEEDEPLLDEFDENESD
ncbi:MAG: DUF2007 domain-containing protein [Anaerolineaceae bacterium]|nr:DUF2007 domain-containing protein [Anaerolineaceae bacterium]